MTAGMLLPPQRVALVPAALADRPLSPAAQRRLALCIHLALEGGYAPPLVCVYMEAGNGRTDPEG